jgi:two-component system, sensor histidine kinase and response regulator
MTRYDILLIGDGTRFLQTIRWVLEYQGYSVKTTDSPEAALEALVRKNYDLVVAQVSATNLEGLDLLERAKRLNPAVKVMVVSANHDAVFPLEAYEIDVDDYILMPVSPAELWRRVKLCLGEGEVVDLQAVHLALHESREAERMGPETMLWLHDLRGAMVANAASLKLLARGFYGEVGETGKAKLQEVAGRIEKMGRQTEDFIRMAMAKRHAGRADEQPVVVDLKADVVEPVLEELAATLQERRIELVNRLADQPAGMLPIRGNKLLLRSIFRNLVNNGITYGGRGCTIVLDMERNGSDCRLHVYNTGKTVPEASRHMIFAARPEKAPPRKRRRGLGVGLSLSRKILQNQGGDMWYEAKNGGSNFVMSLPQQ